MYHELAVDDASGSDFVADVGGQVVTIKDEPLSIFREITLSLLRSLSFVERVDLTIQLGNLPSCKSNLHQAMKMAACLWQMSDLRRDTDAGLYLIRLVSEFLRARTGKWITMARAEMGSRSLRLTSPLRYVHRWS
jgi:hypothetical protein